MTATEPFPALQRPAYFDGQRLESVDLEAMGRYQRELRWLHNRSLHGWGVVTGMQVHGEQGGRVVEVTPGYGLDKDGREVLVPSATGMQVPPAANDGEGADGSPRARTYALTASYLDDASLELQEREGPCAARGAVRLDDRALLRWQAPAEVRIGFDLVLATVAVLGCALRGAPSTDTRRALRERPSPYVMSGETNAPGTNWELGPGGVRAYVDTSKSGFARAPSYMARVDGRRSFSDPITGQVRRLDGFVSIEEPTRSGFLVQVTMPRDLKTSPDTWLNKSSDLGPNLPDVLEHLWRVVWMGTEMA